MVIIKDADHEDALEMYIICDDDMLSLICDDDEKWCASIHDNDK